jgi:hypothetical protein
MEDTQGFAGSPDETTAFWTTYLSMFLITGDMDGARYLWKRLPVVLKSGNAEIAALWNVGKCLLAGDFVALKGIFAGTTWAHAQPFVAEMRAAIEQRQLREIAQAYSVISTTALAEALMSATTADAVAVAQERGWEFSEGGDFVRPRPLPDDAADSFNGQRSYEKDMEMLQNLSAYVAHFEKRPLKVDLTAVAPTISSSSSSGAVGAAGTKMS